MQCSEMEWITPGLTSVTACSATEWITPSGMDYTWAYECNGMDYIWAYECNGMDYIWAYEDAKSVNTMTK